MILSCNNITKSFDGFDIITNCSFHLEEYDKVAIIGLNGVGKTTLLNILSSELSPDTGDVIIQKNKTLGYLSQFHNTNENLTIYEEVLKSKQDIIDMESSIRELELKMNSADTTQLSSLLNSYTKLTHEFELKNGFSYKSEIIGVLKGLGFNEDSFNKKLITLSGGEKTRVYLARLLLKSPDILLLDEPTNHLDIGSINWLEAFISSYKGTVIIVSHDRYFLDKTVNKVIEIENGKIILFEGNYTAFTSKKQLMTDALLKQYNNQQQMIKHQKEVIDKLKSFNREKSIKRAQSREKLLNKVDVLDKPLTYEESMRLSFKPSTISGNDVLTVENLSKSFEDRDLFKNISFLIKRGEKVAIIGDNGTGKTTILKILNDIIAADFGTITLGSKVKIGYYDQEHNNLNEENTIFDEIADAYPDMTCTKIRNLLAAFLFTDDEVFKLIDDLSGGERARVSLAKLMLSESNLLILDEPTNHLDILSKEILENAINNYTGTVLYVSHDRYFINKTATRILEITNKTMIDFSGTYDYYMEKRDLLMPQVLESSEDINLTNVKIDWKLQKEEQAKQRKKENAIKKIEMQIQEIEDKLSVLNKEIASDEVSKSPSKTLEIHNKITELEAKLELLFFEWSELSE